MMPRRRRTSLLPPWINASDDNTDIFFVPEIGDELPAPGIIPGQPGDVTFTREKDDVVLESYLSVREREGII